MTIAAIVPTYNRANLVGRALSSILEQDVLPDEIIVVDDGSTDDTPQVVRASGPAVRYLRQSHGGASAARNAGVGLAESHYIAFLDSDDFWLPDHLSTLRSALHQTQQRASVYFADCYFSPPDSPVTAGQTLWQLADFSPSHPVELGDDPFTWALLPVQPTMLQSSIISKQAYVEAGGLDPRLRLRHDTGLFFVLALLGDPWCAVDHVGASVTAAADNRLTAAFPTSQPEYWRETVRLYDDVLATASHRSAAERAELRARLAVAHWRLARIAYKDRRVSDAMTALSKSLATSPSAIVKRLRWR